VGQAVQYSSGAGPDRIRKIGGFKRLINVRGPAGFLDHERLIEATYDRRREAALDAANSRLRRLLGGLWQDLKALDDRVSELDREITAIARDGRSSLDLGYQRLSMVPRP